MPDRETVATERIARVVWPLAHGQPLTTRQAAALAGITPRGAWRMLTKLCRVLPIYQDDGGVWRVASGAPSRSGAPHG